MNEPSACTMLNSKNNCLIKVTVLAGALKTRENVMCVLATFNYYADERQCKN